MESDDEFFDDVFSPRGKRDTTLKYEEDHTGEDNCSFRNWTEVHNTLGITEAATREWSKAVGAYYVGNPEQLVEGLRTKEEQKKVEPLYWHLYWKFCESVDVTNNMTKKLYKSAIRFCVIR